MKSLTSEAKRKIRCRIGIKRNSNGRLRLSVHRTNKNIYAQVIDDNKRVTVVSASTLEVTFKDDKRSSQEVAEKIGQLVGERALEAGVKDVVFDRGSLIYHGKIKTLADAARKAGLNF